MAQKRKAKRTSKRKPRAEGGTPGTPGRKPFAATNEQRKIVERAAAIGIRQDMIPLLIAGEGEKPIDKSTLRKYFELELRAGAAKATFNVANNLYSMATGTGRQAATCAIFWMKTRAGWKEGMDDAVDPDTSATRIREALRRMDEADGLA